MPRERHEWDVRGHLCVTATVCWFFHVYQLLSCCLIKDSERCIVRVASQFQGQLTLWGTNIHSGVAPKLMQRYHQTVELMDFKRLFVSVTLDMSKESSDMSPPLFKMIDYRLNYKTCDLTFRVRHDCLNLTREFFVNYRYITFYEYFVISVRIFHAPYWLLLLYL